MFEKTKINDKEAGDGPFYGKNKRNNNIEEKVRRIKNSKKDKGRTCRNATTYLLNESGFDETKIISVAEDQTQQVTLIKLPLK